MGVTDGDKFPYSTSPERRIQYPHSPDLGMDLIGVYNGHMVLSLKECLAGHPPIMLKAIAEGWGISLTDEQVPEIVDRLMDEMTNAETVEMVVQRLNDTEREALAYVKHIGRVKAHVLARRYGSIRPSGPGRLEWERSWQRPASASE